MSQTTFKPQKLVIKNKNPGTLLSGANADITLDGQPIKGISFLKVEIKPNKLAKVSLEMYCDIESEFDAVPDIMKTSSQ